MDLLVNVAGVVLIVLIIWWFWLASGKTTRLAASRVIDVLVKDGVYTPARIQVPLNQPLVLRFIREDASPCAEKVLFDDLDLSLELPLGQSTEVELTLKEPGEYHFHCDMQMYRGSLLATD